MEIMEVMDDWFEAAEKGDVETLERMIEKGEDVNRKTSRDSTALIYAAIAGRKDAVVLLINSGAKVNSQDREGLTALIFASLNRDKNIVELLLQAGANPNLQTNTGSTALTFAVNYAHKDVVKLLLQAGADPNLKSNSGYTILSPISDKEIAELLLKYGADPFVPRSIYHKEINDLIYEKQWKRLYARDVDLARRYAQSTSLPKDVWQLILLNKRQQQLCQNMESNKNSGILKYFALELNIPVTQDMSKGKLCALISRQLAYGPYYSSQPERDIQKLRDKVKETAFQFGLDPNLPTEKLLKQLSGIFK